MSGIFRDFFHFFIHLFPRHPAVFHALYGQARRGGFFFYPGQL